MATRSVPTRARDSVPGRPVYVRDGEKQPPEFAEIVDATMAAVRAVDACADEFDDYQDMADALCGALLKTFVVPTIEEYAMVATLCELHAFGSMTGAPNLEVWRPLSERWDEGPPRSTKFFEVDGVPYSVDSNLQTRKWNSSENYIVRDVNEIRGRARRITRARFEVLRAEGGSHHV